MILSFLVVIEASFGSIQNLSEGTLVYEILKIVTIVLVKQKFKYKIAFFISINLKKCFESY